MTAPAITDSFVACDGVVTVSVDRVACSGTWITYTVEDIAEFGAAAAIDRLTDVLEYLFTFDAELFGIVLFGCAIIFAKGWGAGVTLRYLNKSH